MSGAQSQKKKNTSSSIVASLKYKCPTLIIVPSKAAAAITHGKEQLMTR